MAAHSRPFVVGLTGGIGSGKSTVADAFAAHGIEVIDADAISRAQVAPGSPALAAIASHFGHEYLLPDGNLNRRLLRERLFAAPAERLWLEALLHPPIREQIHATIAASTAPWLLLMVPLLLESGAYAWVDRVLVVDLPEALQLTRASQRDGSDAATIQAIMASQLPRTTRLAKADDVIDNSGLPEALAPQVEQLMALYEKLATESLGSNPGF
ncbi:MAG TPA: dephospho-CoA kinase [Hyphomicrobiales bacterium]|nr:dephospho-CoA kinase [Hyphomicrobiales bacterium]